MMTSIRNKGNDMYSNSAFKNVVIKFFSIFVMSDKLDSHQHNLSHRDLVLSERTQQLHRKPNQKC